MAILDSQGRLFGKVSILDVGAALVILLVIFGIFFLPGTTGSSIAQVGVTTKPVEVDVVARGLSVRNPQSLIKPGEKTNFIIRNQPYGQIEIKSINFLPETVIVPQPDGSVKALADPRAQQNYSADLLLTLEGKGQITGNGPVLGNSKIKIGTPVELEGKTYNFKASVIDVRVQD
ncbi:MAG TPA: DUF4330 domain-containing protein [Candidatus Caenarcaniphilales bacterium]